MVGAMSSRQVALRYGPDTIAVHHAGSGIARAARLQRWMPRLLAVIVGILAAWIVWIFGRPSKKGPSPIVALQRFYTEVSYTAVAHSLSFDADGVRGLLVLLEPLTVFKDRMAGGAQLLCRNLLAMPLGQWEVARKNSREILRILAIDHITPLSDFERKAAHGAAYY